LTANYTSPVKITLEKDMIAVRLAAAASARACGSSLHPPTAFLSARYVAERSKGWQGNRNRGARPLILNDDRLIVDAAAT
jgi:hypothetical protein